jgi:hypothetical protein
MDSRVISPWTWQDQFGFVQAHEVSGARRVVYCPLLLVEIEATAVA